MLVLSLVALVLLAYTGLDVATSTPGEVRTLPRWGWALVVLLLPILGPALWLALGRPRRAAPRPPGRPDDDEQFLRDLRRRTEEQRRRAREQDDDRPE